MDQPTYSKAENLERIAHAAERIASSLETFEEASVKAKTESLEAAEAERRPLGDAGISARDSEQAYSWGMRHVLDRWADALKIARDEAKDIKTMMSLTRDAIEEARAREN